MNTTTLLIALISALTGFLSGSTFSNSPENQPEKNPSIEQASEIVVPDDYVSLRPGLYDLPAESLTQEERTNLIFMREEEKLARDVYQTLYDQWKLPIFTNIAQSEQTHTEAIRYILEKYQIEDPVTDDNIGVFQDSSLQSLYDTLVKKGLASEIEALRVGALIEDLDITDLEKAIAQTDNTDIQLVYENLMRGSRNHLRSFTTQLKSRGQTYVPEYLTEEAYQAIVTSSAERGSNGKQGRGWGGNR